VQQPGAAHPERHGATLVRGGDPEAVAQKKGGAQAAFLSLCYSLSVSRMPAPLRLPAALDIEPENRGRMPRRFVDDLTPVEADHKIETVMD